MTLFMVFTRGKEMSLLFSRKNGQLFLSKNGAPFLLRKLAKVEKLRKREKTQK
jgi:hypothetical protein